MIIWPDLNLPPINLWSIWNMESPCKRKCLYNSRLGFCESCGRSIEEISRWERFGDSYRLEIINRAKQRLLQMRNNG